jgi:hypothetical protein
MFAERWPVNADLVIIPMFIKAETTSALQNVESEFVCFMKLRVHPGRTAKSVVASRITDVRNAAPPIVMT